MKTKTCIDCKRRKPLDEFYFNAKGRPGSYCKPCASCRSLIWQEMNPEKYAATRKKWVENNPNYWKVSGL